jgi:hypothetical protein
MNPLFPGMDPYIEASGLWPDFHPHLIEKIVGVLADSVPERYLVRTGERPSDPLGFRETFVAISDPTAEQQLVTSVEVLSPSNKARGTEGRELYLRKRQGLLLGAVNLVEIDLLRGGERMPMFDPWPDSPYAILVACRRRMPHCLAYPAQCLKPLPTIHVPLNKPDPDLPLALQPLVDAIYRRSRYHRSIDYTRPLSPPLAAAEASWVEQQLRERAEQNPG